jgi:hypothetical protein
MTLQQRLDAIEVLLVICKLRLQLGFALSGPADRVLKRPDLQIGQREVGLCPVYRRLIWPWIDDKEKLPRLYVLIVLDRHLHDGAADMRGDPHHIGAYVCIIGVREDVVEPRNICGKDNRNYDNVNTDHMACHSESNRLMPASRRCR